MKQVVGDSLGLTSADDIPPSIEGGPVEAPKVSSGSIEPSKAIIPPSIEGGPVEARIQWFKDDGFKDDGSKAFRPQSRAAPLKRSTLDIEGGQIRVVIPPSIEGGPVEAV